MTIKIGSNIASLNAQRKLGEAEASLSKVFERLSSGQRINRASDDAAGLAIADDLKAKSRIYTQAIRNGNDGISLLNIADSALDAPSGVVTRIRELSEQAANGTYSSQQRKALDAEAQALSKEFTRITQTTSFNGIKIFDGSLGTGLRLQLGIGASESVNASIGGAVGTGNFQKIETSNNIGSGSAFGNLLADLNSDGFLDLIVAGSDGFNNGQIVIQLGSGNGSFSDTVYYTTDSRDSYALSIGDLNNDGILDLVTSGVSDSMTGSASVRLGNGDGTFGAITNYSMDSIISYAVNLSDLNGDNILDLITSGRTAGTGSISIRLGKGDGSFGDVNNYSTDIANPYVLQLADLNNDNILDVVTAGFGVGIGNANVALGRGDGTFHTPNKYTMDGNNTTDLDLVDFNSDGILDLVSAGNNGINGTVTYRLGSNNGSFGNINTILYQNFASNAEVHIGDINGDGILDISTSSYGFSLEGYLSFKLGKADGSFHEAIILSDPSGTFGSNIAFGDLNGDGVTDLISSGFEQYTYIGSTTVWLADATQGLGALLGFSLKTKSDALQSMAILDRTLENLSKQRGTIGASQSRIGIALNNLQAATENFKAAESRIRDADIASESANLIRTQILQQAAASVLSQVNAQPQLVLQLLR